MLLSMKKIIPAILTDSMEDLREKLRRIEGAAPEVQIDITDGLFVGGVSVSVADLAAVRTPLGIGIHLMVTHPEKYFSGCAAAHVQQVVFHYEACDDARAVIGKAKKYPFQHGIALNPETPVDVIMPFGNEIKYVLLLGVHPGAQGQTFISSTIEKVAALRQALPHVTIGVDGGVSSGNISNLAATGADQFVVGSAIFSQADAKNAIKHLQRLANT